MSTSLYKMTDDLNALMDSDSDEITDSLINIISGEIEVKAEIICKFLKVLETTADQFKAEEKRIAAARKSLENKADRVRECMKAALLNANIDKVTAGTFKVSVSLNQGSVAIDSPDLIPARFMTIIPEQHIPDKAAIAAAIKGGENVTGAHIEAGYTLRIK
jgi:cell fate (sporulation/competence/biofilm development) regulator YmcA (YheA/YmcA/DUF963 family)